MNLGLALLRRKRRGVRRVNIRLLIGGLYIHASKKKINKNDEHIVELLELIYDVPMGYDNILCKCNLVDCVPMNQEFLDKMQEDKQELLCGIYSLGRYAWILKDIEPLLVPIPARGFSIWSYEENHMLK